MILNPVQRGRIASRNLALGRMGGARRGAAQGVTARASWLRGRRPTRRWPTASRASPATNAVISIAGKTGVGGFGALRARRRPSSASRPARCTSPRRSDARPSGSFHFNPTFPNAGRRSAANRGRARVVSVPSRRYEGELPRLRLRRRISTSRDSRRRGGRLVIYPERIVALCHVERSAYGVRAQSKDRPCHPERSVERSSMRSRRTSDARNGHFARALRCRAPLAGGHNFP